MSWTFSLITTFAATTETGIIRPESAMIHARTGSLTWSNRALITIRMATLSGCGCQNLPKFQVIFLTDHKFSQVLQIRTHFSFCLKKLLRTYYLLQSKTITSYESYYFRWKSSLSMEPDSLRRQERKFLCGYRLPKADCRCPWMGSTFEQKASGVGWI